ncbi:hypothetical protein AUEXF2481DRAFT_570619 [Aureobasidium subglaciale EXF-2481]|uniref:Uncharacterized protein n=1 Tax=Aureobasidium subglaciale (strain EXF-2481) TaxID=1043005 RepID=A0A074Y3D8_AURSE|nr:uncharacterized protein AUEXF2481DRAFT_570619 [Aureobasidium subglaciale EXF-2481]KEQ90459.1 hypothetical protein AUEXF2481DRAFT_570619 [Aureobasidium subglaciale EXF-2481]
MMRLVGLQLQGGGGGGGGEEGGERRIRRGKSLVVKEKGEKDCEKKSKKLNLNSLCVGN